MFRLVDLSYYANISQYDVLSTDSLWLGPWPDNPFERSFMLKAFELSPTYICG